MLLNPGVQAHANCTGSVKLTASIHSSIPYTTKLQIRTLAAKRGVCAKVILPASCILYIYISPIIEKLQSACPKPDAMKPNHWIQENDLVITTPLSGCSSRCTGMYCPYNAERAKSSRPRFGRLIKDSHGVSFWSFTVAIVLFQHSSGDLLFIQLHLVFAPSGCHHQQFEKFHPSIFTVSLSGAAIVKHPCSVSSHLAG